jgi:hypothetical protein
MGDGLVSETEKPAQKADISPERRLIDQMYEHQGEELLRQMIRREVEAALRPPIVVTTEMASARNPYIDMLYASAATAKPE